MVPMTTTETPVGHDQYGRPLYACDSCGEPHNVTAAWCRTTVGQITAASKGQRKATHKGASVATGASKPATGLADRHAEPITIRKAEGRPAPATPAYRWSEAQTRYARNLVAWIADHDAELSAMWTDKLDRIVAAGQVNPSSVIDDLKIELTNAKELARTARKAAQSTLPAVAEGFYALPSTEGSANEIVFYRVWHGRNGYVGLHREVGPSDVRVPFAQVASILARIAGDTAGAMQRYGRETGVCGRCHRRLTNDESRAIGIGPECRKR